MSVRAFNASDYQWYIDRGDRKGFVAISGANGSGYTTSPAEARNNGYRCFCRVSNGYGYVDSAIFTLNIAGMNISKTGDASSLRPALLVMGAMVIRRRKSVR